MTKLIIFGLLITNTLTLIGAFMLLKFVLSQFELAIEYIRGVEIDDLEE